LKGPGSAAPDPVFWNEDNMEKKKAPPVVSDINVTPMVDVMLVLLIIFMVITPMLSKGTSVDLVKTKNPITMQNADKEDAVLIAVTRDGKVFLSPGNVQISPDTLPQKVKDLLTSKTDKTVYIKSDARARYERVEDVVDNLRAAGVDQIGLLTEPLPDRNKPSPPIGGVTPAKSAP
jgi:biopolymer transport protein ExbD/biopolymer transport protein TolR